MFKKNLLKCASEMIEACRANHLMVATVESCTGGLVAGSITSVSGSSDVLDRSFVTYSNEAKNELVDVPMEFIEKYGAVSAEVAEAMARGGIAHSNAQIAVSITGIAGPGGGTKSKPVGLVHFGCLRKGGRLSLHRKIISGNRDGVRETSVLIALKMLREAAD